MAYVAPTTANAVAGSAILASDMLTVMNDIIDHETYVSPLRTGWSTWTPSYTNLSGGTTNMARYAQSGKLVVCQWKYTLGGAGVSGQVKVSLPLTAGADVASGQRIGLALLNSQGTDIWDGVVLYSTTTTVIISRLFADSGASYSVKARDLSSTQPFTWKNTDVMVAQWAYEAA